MMQADRAYIRRLVHCMYALHSVGQPRLCSLLDALQISTPSRCVQGGVQAAKHPASKTIAKCWRLLSSSWIASLNYLLLSASLVWDLTAGAPIKCIKRLTMDKDHIFRRFFQLALINYHVLGQQSRLANVLYIIFFLALSLEKKKKTCESWTNKLYRQGHTR